MQKRDKRCLPRGKSIFTVSFAFMLFCVAALIGISDYIYNVSSKELESSLIEYRMTDVRNIASSLNDELAAIQNQCHLMLLDKNIQALAATRATMKRYEVSDYSRKIIERLSNCLSQYSMISTLQIMFPHDNYMITDMTAYTISPERTNEFLRIIDDFPAGFFYSDKGIGFWSTYPYPFSQSKKDKSTLRMGCIEMSEDSILKTLNAYKETVHDCELLLMVDNRILVQTQASDWILEKGLSLNNQPGHYRLQHDGQDYFLLYQNIKAANITACILTPIDSAMASMYRVQHLMQILKYTSCTVFLITSIGLYGIIYKPLGQMRRTMIEVGDGELNRRMPEMWCYEFNTMGHQFNNMAERLQGYIEREYEYKLLVKEAEMKQLQYQISPHFLYNTYFQLRNLLSVEDVDNANRLAGLLGDYLRYIVHVKNGEARLSEEIKHAVNYAEIQKLRFQNRISVEADIDIGDWTDLHVPCLIIQPLVENAFGHGMKDMLSGGLICITVRMEGNTLRIIVEDNGSNLHDDDLAAIRDAIVNERMEFSGGIALMNIAQRIRVAYQERGSLAVSRSILGGLRAAIQIEIMEVEMRNGTSVDG